MANPTSESPHAVLLTPDSRGRLQPPPHAKAVFPASRYLEGAAPADLEYLPDIWADRDRAAGIAARSALIAHTLARSVNEALDGRSDEDRVPLSLDIVTRFVEPALERMLRLADSRARAGDLPLWPTAVRHALPEMISGRLFRSTQKTQAFQWLIFRLLAGTSDMVEWQSPAALVRLKRRLSRALWIGRQKGGGRGGLFAAHLGRCEQPLRSLGVPLEPVPDLVQRWAVRRDPRRRARLADLFTAALSPSFAELGLRGGGVSRLADFFSETFPVSRVELREENARRYARFFDDVPVRGFVTSNGQGKTDENAFFIAECHRRGIPTVIIQHGGQYGYDDKIASFFTMDMGLPSLFVSWGWAEFPGPYDRRHQRARIVPLPEPRLSELRGQPRPSRRPGQPRTLLIPLSKFRTLENRVGGNATDGVVGELRRQTFAVMSRLQDDFDRFVLTYRSPTFDGDELQALLPRLGHDRVEVLSAKQAPASTLLARADAVLWDVTATGLFETLTSGIPTVALFRRGRWATEAAWAEDLLVSTGVGAYEPEAAARALVRFVGQPSEWAEARRAVQPVLDRYALSAEDWKAPWCAFLSGLGGPAARAAVAP